MKFAVIWNRNTSALLVENPPFRTLQTNLVLPVPVLAPKISWRLCIQFWLLAASFLKVVPFVAGQAKAIVVIPSSAEIAYRDTKANWAKESSLGALITDLIFPFCTIGINIRDLALDCQLTFVILEGIAHIATSTLTIFLPFSTIVVDGLAHILFVKVPPDGTLLAFAVWEAFTPTIYGFSQILQDALAIINFISKITLLANTNGSIEFFTLWSNFRTYFIIVENVVWGTLSAATIHPSFATKIIIKGSKEAQITVFNRCAKFFLNGLRWNGDNEEEEKEGQSHLKVKLFYVKSLKNNV